MSMSKRDVRRKRRTLYVESKAETILTCAGWWKSLKTEAAKRRANQPMGVRRYEGRLGRTVRIPSLLVPSLKPVTLRPRLPDQSEVGDSHETLDRPIQRKNEREVGEAQDPVLLSVRDAFLPAYELEDVGEVGHGRAEQDGRSREVSARRARRKKERSRDVHRDGRREAQVGGVDNLA